MLGNPFDVVFHLIGKESLPNVFAIHALPAACHVLFATNETGKVTERIRRAVGEEGCVVVRVDPYDLNALSQVFREQLARFKGKRLAINLTGGTKLMALMLAREAEPFENVPQYYLETAPRACLIDIRTAQVRLLTPPLRTVREYVALNSEAMFREGCRAWGKDAIVVAQVLADDRFIRKQLGMCVGELAEALPTAKYGFVEGVFDAKWQTLAKTLEVDCRDRAAYGRFVGALEGVVKEAGKEAACRLLTGTWLEVFAFTALSGREGLRDVQQSAVVKFPDGRADQQELDVAFCSAHHLYLVECKSGKVTGEDVNAFNNIVTSLGGSQGRGILLASRQFMGHSKENYENLKTRIKAQSNVMLVELPIAPDSEFLVNAVRAWAPGVYQAPRSGARFALGARRRVSR